MLDQHRFRACVGAPSSLAVWVHQGPGRRAAAGLLCLTLLAASQAAADLVGYWSFEADDAADGSGYGNDGSLVNGPVFTDDVPATIPSARSISFNGADNTGSYVQIPHADSLSFTGGMVTVSFWMKANAADPSPWLRAINKDNGGSHGFEIQRNDAGATAALRIDTATNNQSKAIGPAWNGAWNHIVFSLNNGMANVWLNGVRTVNNSAYFHTGGFDNTADLIMGRSFQESAREYDGLMDDVAVWDTALNHGMALALYRPICGYDVTQMQTLFNVYTSGVPATIGERQWHAVSNLLLGEGQSFVWTNRNEYYLQLDAAGKGVASTNLATAAVDLVGYWTFDGEDASDFSGFGNDGTVESHVAFTNDTPTGTGRAAAFFGGSDSLAQIAVPNSQTLAVNDAMTLSFWVKMYTNTPSWTRFLRKSDESSARNGWLIDRDSGSFNIGVRYDTGGGGGLFNQNRLFSSGSEIDGTWHHVVIVAYDNGSGTTANGTTKKFVDGVLKRSETYDHGTGFGNTSPLEFNNQGNFIGRLDEVALWYDALTDGMAIALYDPVLGFDQTQMRDLFNVFLTGQERMVGGRRWKPVSGLSLGEGQSAISGDNIYLQLDAAGNGVAVIISGTLFALF